MSKLKMFAVLVSGLLLLELTGCVPCKCEEASLDAASAQAIGVRSLKIKFDDPLFRDNPFQITIIDQSGGIRTIGGTWKMENDTITFKSDTAEFLSFRSGQINRLDCSEDGSFTITPPGGGVPLKFFCTKKR